jgi:hypothetical protein
MFLDDMTEKQLQKSAAQILGRKGAAVRNGSLTPEQRKAHGKMMSAARWGKPCTDKTQEVERKPQGSTK